MPIVQFTFSHKLNESVQVGDIAYFSNPTAVPPPGTSNWYGPIPALSNAHGTSYPPHKTSIREDIIKIGEIEEIIFWDGSTNSIICNMSQALYNSYANNFVVGGSTYQYNFITGTGAIAGYQTVANIYPLDFTNYHSCATCQNSAALAANMPNPLPIYLQANQQENIVNVVFRYVRDGDQNVWISDGYAAIPTNDPYYQPGRINGFIAVSGFTIVDNSGTTYYEPQNTTTLPFPVVADPLKPYSYGVAAQAYPNAVSIEPTDFVPLKGTVGNGTLVNTQGSFIMFSKNNKANQSDVLGYYALVEFRNSAINTGSELFNAGITYSNSSK